MIVSTDTRAARALIYAILVSSFVFAAGSAVDYAVNRPERLFSAWGILIPFGMGGIYSVYFMPVNYVFFVFYKRKRTALLAMANFLLLSPVLVWQLSRAAWAAVGSCVLFFSVFRKRVFGACALALFVITLFFLPAAKVRMERIPDIVYGWGERVPEWEAGLRIFMEHPFVGAGPGMYEKMMFNYDQKFPFTEGRRNSHCHNTYLEVLAETGIAGLAGFLAVFIGLGGMVARYLERNRRRIGDFSTTAVIALSGLIASTLIFALAGTVIVVGINEPLFFWLAAGMLAGILEENSHGRDTGKSDR
jgi:O-antigen ligase